MQIYRETCYYCTIKHLSEALAISLELPFYPEHWKFLNAALTQAEQEIFEKEPDIGFRIRDLRKAFEDTFYSKIDVAEIESLLDAVRDIMLTNNIKEKKAPKEESEGGLP